MTSIFYGLEIGRKALQAQQKAMEVTGHNIANVNTPGFTRQQAIFVSTAPETIPSFNSPHGAQVGSGVDIKQILRVRDAFIDIQIRNENSLGGYWESRQEALSRMEGILGEPSEYGLRSAMDKFWQAWQDLVTNAESEAARTVLASSAQAMIDTFHQLDRQINTYLTDLDRSLFVQLTEVNDLAKQIAALNKQIAGVEISGEKANDLRDKREVMLDDLSRLINFTYSEDNLGYINIQVDGQNLVQGVTALEITADPVTYDLTLDGNSITLTSGAIKGRIESIADVRLIEDKLDTLAAALVEEVNRIHQLGYYLPDPPDRPDPTTGGNFFDPANTDAGTISLLPEIAAGDMTLIAASKYDDSTGDGSNALDLARIGGSKLAALGDVTPGDYYRAVIAKLGVDSRSASDMLESQTILVESLSTSRQAVSGVSLDEEMAHLIVFQNSFNAAARLITTIDEMMELLVNRLGLVGR